MPAVRRDQRCQVWVWLAVMQTSLSAKYDWLERCFWCSNNIWGVFDPRRLNTWAIFHVTLQTEFYLKSDECPLDVFITVCLFKVVFHRPGQMLGCFCHACDVNICFNLMQVSFNQQNTSHLLHSTTHLLYRPDQGADPQEAFAKDGVVVWNCSPQRCPVDVTGTALGDLLPVCPNGACRVFVIVPVSVRWQPADLSTC